MPKKWHGRLEDIAALDNLWAAYSWVYKRAKRNKVHYTVKGIKDIAGAIMSGEWEPFPPSEYDHFEPSSNKWRHIVAPEFETKIVERAIIQIYIDDICSFLHPKMCGSIPYRGTRRVYETVSSWSKLPDKRRRYFYKGDIVHCFQTITVDEGMREWKRHIGDTRVHHLIWQCLSLESSRYHRENPCLLIGSALAHPTANLVLSSVAYAIGDHVVFQMDDFVFLGGNKRTMKRKYARACDALAEKGLVLHDTQLWHWQKTPIDIAGYKVYWSGKKKERKRTFINTKRLLRSPYLTTTQRERLGSLYGCAKNSDSSQLKIDIKEKMKNEDRKKHAGPCAGAVLSRF